VLKLAVLVLVTDRESYPTVCVGLEGNVDHVDVIDYFNRLFKGCRPKASLVPSADPDFQSRILTFCCDARPPLTGVPPSMMSSHDGPWCNRQIEHIDTF
jgi:hypothetical protein